MSDKNSKQGFKVKLGLFLLFILVVFGALLLALEGDRGVTNLNLVGEPVPSFTLQSLEDESLIISNADIQSGDYQLLNVWASWCPTCKTEHEFLKRLNEKGVRIIGINYRDERKDALKALSEWGNPFKAVLYDRQGSFALDLGVIGSPETFLISPDGIILTRFSGELDQKVWDKHFMPLINGIK